MAPPVLEVDNLRVHYLTRFGAKIRAVDGVTFSLKEGEILGIAGESGCGKTTLVSGCMGLYLPPLYHTSGDVRIEGKSIVDYLVKSEFQVFMVSWRNPTAAQSHWDLDTYVTALLEAVRTLGLA